MSINNDAVKSLIHELEEKIKILTSTSVKANLDISTYNDITTIISKYTKRAPKDITIEEIVDFKISDLSELLQLMCVQLSEINSMITNFSPNVYLYRSNNESSLAYFNKIRTMIVSYITDYIDYSNNQNDSQNSKVAEYQKYIDILKSEKLENPTEEIENITRLMETIAFPQEDCWKVQMHLAKLNLTTIEDKKLTDMKYEVEILRGEYLDKNQELSQIVLNEIKNKDLDIDLIPTYAIELANKLNIDRVLVQNIIVAIMANNILYTYITTDNNPDTLDATFKTVIEKIIYPLEAALLTAEEILDQNNALIASAIELSDEEIKRYIDLTIEDLTSEGATLEEAIDYKMLPILKAIAESVDKLNILVYTNEDYNECLETLEELIKMYQEKTVKNELELKRIN